MFSAFLGVVRRARRSARIRAPMGYVLDACTRFARAGVGATSMLATIGCMYTMMYIFCTITVDVPIDMGI